MPSSDLFFSIAITPRYCYTLDSEGYLWRKYYYRGNLTGPFEKVIYDLPLCKTLFNVQSTLYLLDFSGDVWVLNENNNSINVVLLNNYNDVVALAYYKGNILGLTSDGRVISNRGYLEYLPLLTRLSGDQMCAGIDYEGDVWIWTNKDSLQKLSFIDTPAIGIVVENYDIKIIGNSGKLWKYTNKSKELTTLYEDLPPIRSISASGIHSIVIDEEDHIWVWGANKNGICGIEARTFIPNPIKLNDITWHSAISSQYFSFAITKEGKLYRFTLNGIKEVKEIEYVFIHKPFRFKSARK